MIRLYMIVNGIHMPIVGCMTCGENSVCINTNVLLEGTCINKCSYINASVLANKFIPLHMKMTT